MSTKDKIPPKITESEIKEALLRSGYLLEQRAEQLLTKRIWYVFSNTAYPDPITGKSRELDVSALQLDGLDQKENNGKPKAILFTWLYIECINNTQPITLFPKFRFDPDDSSAVRFFADPSQLIYQEKEKKRKGFKEPRVTKVRSLLAFWEFHHYCQGSISTQYASFIQKKDGTWMAWHEEQHNDDFKALADMVRYKFDKLGESERQQSDPVPVLVNMYPVLLIQGELVEVGHNETGELTVKHVDRGSYVRTMIHDGKEEEIQIDIVTEKAFPQFLDLIDMERKEILNRIRPHIDNLQQQLNRKV